MAGSEHTARARWALLSVFLVLALTIGAWVRLSQHCGRQWRLPYAKKGRFTMYNQASRPWALAALSGLILMTACMDTPTLPTEVDAQFAKGGNKGKPGGGDGDSFNYTITDLGMGGVSDINDAGLIVGSAPSDVAFRAARWTADTDGAYSMELLGDGVWESGPGSWAAAVNLSGAAVGTITVDADFTDRAALWSLGGVELLSLLDPAHLSQAYGINDAGQISGQSYTGSYGTARAVRWEPNGSVTDLGVLPGYEKSIGWAINDLGWVGGSSGVNSSEFPAKRQHAVLWIDDGSGQISAPLDLHPVPEIRSIVKGISDVRDGKVYVVGQLDFSRPVVWVVDVATPHGVIEHVLEEVSGGAEAVNAAGEVQVVVSGPAVWTPATDLLEPLPTLSNKCYSKGRGINNLGTVVGWSGVFAKGRCVEHLVVWTKVMP